MKSSYQVGHDLLGPIIYRFCYQLWMNQHAWHDRDAIALFLSRGGIRLRYFYEQFLQANSLERPVPLADYYISRMAAMKANFLRQPGAISAELAKEFNYWHVHDAMGALLPWGIFEPWWNELGVQLQEQYRVELITAGKFQELIADEHPGSAILVGYFAKQAELARMHLDQVRDGKADVLLVDTGWSGSILSIIQQGSADINFMGHFFGRYAYGEDWKPWFTHLVGVGVEDKGFRWQRPHTTLFQHRHLIEGMCEPVWPSVEWYTQNDSGTVMSQAGPIPDEVIVPGEDAPFAKGVTEYIQKAESALSAYTIHERAHLAARKLRRLVCFPAAAEVRVMTVETRSADFGKNLDVPVILETGSNLKLDERIANIRRSLWPEAQIALEFGFLRIPLQLLHLLDRPRLIRFFDWLSGKSGRGC